MGPGHGSELDHRLVGGGTSKTGVFDPAEVEKLLPGYHEGRQVGGVNGQKHDRKHRPDVRHEPESLIFIIMKRK